MQAAFDPARVKRANIPTTARTRLYLTYSLMLVLAAALGLVAYRLWPDILPRAVYVWLDGLAIPQKNEKIFDLIASIVYNSVDIFKISAIIIAVGFTYVTAPLCRAAMLFYGISSGWALGCIVRTSCSGSTAWAAVVIICAMLQWLVTISCCVRAELISDELCRLRHPRIILTSRAFWSYIMWLLITFGYTVMISLCYRLLLIFIL